jgi:septal ring factor EnvC (AmiA/AmiB activator)
VALLAVLLLGLLPARARAQDAGTHARRRAQRDSLEQIRAERTPLEARMRELQTSAHDLSEEVTNLNRRADATARIVSTLDAQLVTISADVHDATGNLIHTEDDLTSQRAILQNRLEEIYKRGPLFTVQVLLGAQSFGDLVARYKYLHLLALRDRALVAHVDTLRNRVTRERNRLVTLQNDVAQNRADKEQEEANLRELERERSRNLNAVTRQVAQTEARLEAVRRTESAVTSTIAELEAARRRAVAANPSAAPSRSSISTSDYGKLDWPVDGTILYPFGRQVQSNNTTIRWNGIGIAAPEGTNVHVVAAGEVVSVSPLGLYGLTVIVDHGGGDYSIYGSLKTATVARGDHVTRDQVIGTVGAADPDFPPHLHFEVRRNGGREPIDPTTWLRHKN